MSLSSTIYTSLTYLQGWWLVHFPGQPVPKKISLSVKKFFSGIQSKPDTYLPPPAFYIDFMPVFMLQHIPDMLPCSIGLFLLSSTPHTWVPSIPCCWLTKFHQPRLRIHYIYYSYCFLTLSHIRLLNKGHTLHSAGSSLSQWPWGGTQVKTSFP